MFRLVVEGTAVANAGTPGVCCSSHPRFTFVSPEPTSRQAAAMAHLTANLLRPDDPRRCMFRLPSPSYAHLRVADLCVQAHSTPMFVSSRWRSAFAKPARKGAGAALSR